MQTSTCVRRSRVPAWTLLAAMIAVLGASGSKLAADETFVYGLNLKGKVGVNGTVLDSLKSKFDDSPTENIEQRFADLLISGADRYALRRDGEIHKNGKKTFDLPYNAILRAEWLNLALIGSNVHSLREDGFISFNNSVIASLPTLQDNFNFPFSRLAPSGTDLYSLRVDGAIFKNGNTTPLLVFTGGNGISGLGDGKGTETVWIRLAVSPTESFVYALRADGVVYKGKLAPANATEAKGSLVTKLPFPASLPATTGDLYVDFDFASDGKWHALRANGQVFNELHVLSPVVDFPGEATSSESSYQDLTFVGTDFWSIRGDGRVYMNTSLDFVFDFPQDLYARVAIGSVPPDLSSFKNSPPVVSTYKVTALEGANLSIPVVVTDSDKPAEDLTVVAIQPLPPGATFDDATRVLTWNNAGPVGKYVFLVQVGDGVKAPKIFKYPIKIVLTDPNPLKNKPPVVSKIKPVQALVGFPLQLPIIATDPDGDPVTISTNTALYPFTSGATFDTSTNTFSWTPTISDVGKLKVKFFISDGLKTKTLTVSFKILSPLIF